MTTVQRANSTERINGLHAKIALPRPPTPLVARTPLLDYIDAHLDHKLTLISAPAGYGKTSLASAWIARYRTEQRVSPAAWVALDTGDNDPVRFWRCVLAAC